LQESEFDESTLNTPLQEKEKAPAIKIITPVPAVRVTFKIAGSSQQKVLVVNPTLTINDLLELANKKFVLKKKITKVFYNDDEQFLSFVLALKNDDILQFL